MELEDHLSPQFCKEIIDRYEKDDRHQPGVTMKGLTPEIKDSRDLFISRLLEWDDVCDKLDIMLRDGVKIYEKHLSKFAPIPTTFDHVWHTGYQIQKSGHYEWHEDAAVHRGRKRLLTFIWYLNVVEGGETEFIDKTVKPEPGKLVIFPSTWTYHHRGNRTTGKYIITGWLWADL